MKLIRAQTAPALVSCTNTHLMRNVAIKGFSFFFPLLSLSFCVLFYSSSFSFRFAFFFPQFIDYKIPKCNTDKQRLPIHTLKTLQYLTYLILNSVIEYFVYLQALHLWVCICSMDRCSIQKLLRSHVPAVLIQSITNTRTHTQHVLYIEFGACILHLSDIY